MSVLNVSKTKQEQAAALAARIAEFQANGGSVRRRRGTVTEISAPPASYFTSAEAPKALEQMNTWETALAKLAVLGNSGQAGTIEVVWSDGRTANNVDELYGL